MQEPNLTFTIRYRDYYLARGEEVGLIEARDYRSSARCRSFRSTTNTSARSVAICSSAVTAVRARQAEVSTRPSDEE
jgi:hypothetical protein